MGGTTIADSLRDARVALRSAWYDAAIELLDGCEDWPSDEREGAIVIKADAILRRDPVGAVTYLTSVRDLVSSPAGRFGYEIQTGKTYAQVRDIASAESHYEEARALASQAPNGLHTMAFHDMRMRWIRRECDPNAPEVALALAHPDPSIACAAYSFRAWLAAGAGDYVTHKADLMTCLEFATKPTAEPVDVLSLSAAAHSLAQFSFESADAEGIEAARAAVAAIAWSPDVNAYRFMAVRALGWDAFMRGRAGEAQWAFKEARSYAPTTAWRVMTYADRAYVARVSHNEAWAIDELAEADRQAYDVNWESCFNEERQALIELAALNAPNDAARAQRYAALYSQIGTENMDPRLAVNGDRRMFAHGKFAQGRIDQTLGRKDAAIATLTEAYEIYNETSYHYRATVVASALAELTGDLKWRDASVQHAKFYPDSPFATLADNAVAAEESLPKELSPLQRQIARALWTGAEPAELSRRFSRSMYTIQQQIQTVFDAFGVGSRTALLQEARKRGLA